MRVLIKEVLISLGVTAALVFIVCGVYPVMVFAMAQGFFPYKANGSIIYRHGTAVGSRLLGQQFTQPQYFHPRPSAAGRGYDGTASGGSNLGPTSKKLIDTVNERVQQYRAENNLSEAAAVPADAVTTSASGLDPHISVENASIQTVRVAKARNLDVDRVREEVRRHTERRSVGILGEPRVNVLNLNLALDDAQKKAAPLK